MRGARGKNAGEGLMKEIKPVGREERKNKMLE
jgi:hypothetical protein